MYNYQKRLLEEATAVPQKEVVLTEGIIDYIKNAIKREPLVSQIVALRALRGKISKTEYEKRIEGIKNMAATYLFKGATLAAMGVTIAHRTGLMKILDKVIHHIALDPHHATEIDHLIHSALGMVKVFAEYTPEGETLDEAPAATASSKDYNARVMSAMAIVKAVKQKAKQLGVRVDADGKTVTCTKEFTKGDKNAFRHAYDACYSVICLFKFTKNTNLWGCSTAGFGIGAQECIKNGRIVLNKSGDGTQLQFRGLKGGLYLSNGMRLTEENLDEVIQINELSAGDTVKVPHKGKMVKGKIVRYDDGGSDKARQSGGGYVVDVGEPASILVPANKVVKEAAEQIDELSKMRRLGQTVGAMIHGKPTPSDRLKDAKDKLAYKRYMTPERKAKEAEIDAKIRKLNAAVAIEEIKRILDDHDKQERAMIISGIKSIKEAITVKDILDSKKNPQLKFVTKLKEWSGVREFLTKSGAIEWLHNVGYNDVNYDYIKAQVLGKKYFAPCAIIHTAIYDPSANGDVSHNIVVQPKGMLDQMSSTYKGLGSIAPGKRGEKTFSTGMKIVATILAVGE